MGNGHGVSFRQVHRKSVADVVEETSSDPVEGLTPRFLPGPVYPIEGVGDDQDEENEDGLVDQVEDLVSDPVPKERGDADGSASASNEVTCYHDL